MRVILLALTVLACTNSPADPNIPGKPFTVWVEPGAEKVHPGLHEAHVTARRAWCKRRGFCFATVKPLGAPLTPGDWIVSAGGNSGSPRRIATMDYAKGQFYYYARTSDGDRIRLVPRGECNPRPGERHQEIDVVVAHEFGHAFFLPHEAEAFVPIMRPSSKCDGMWP